MDNRRERKLERLARERILDEGGLREATPVESAGARRLAHDLEGSPLQGKPLPHRLRNFRPAVDAYVSAQGGPLPYMARLREIEAETAAHEERFERAWQALARVHRGDGEAFARRWRETAAGWDFGEVNDLIARHNRWFPVETRLPMDPRTGDFVLVAGRSYRRKLLDADWVLERFPPLLARAVA